MTRRITALSIAAAAVLALPAPASALTESAAAGAVSAALTYEVTPNANVPFSKEVSTPQLTISRAGQLVYNSPVVSALPNCREGNNCLPASVLSEEGNSLEVVDLESSGEPDVLVHLFSGGAHCCSIVEIYRWNPETSTYSVLEHSWGDPNARLVDLRHNGQLEFVTADDRFAYAFASYGFSGLPVQVFAYRGGALVDVTRSYPSLISSDARAQFRRYRADLHFNEGLGVLAAWVADEYRLGKKVHALQTVRRENALGHLRSSLGRTYPTGRAYIRALTRFLGSNGYG